MPNPSGALHHQSIRKRIHAKFEPYPHPNRLKRFVDKLVYLIAFLSPIMNLPQLYVIYAEKNASGVSLLSWSSFTVFSVIWLFYGILHKEKPIIFMNGGLLIAHAFIVAGIVLYS